MRAEDPDMKQLELQLHNDEVDVDLLYDRSRPDIQYIGKARKQNNGLWVCLANVGGALCLVEVAIAGAAGVTGVTGGNK